MYMYEQLDSMSDICIQARQTASVMPSRDGLASAPIVRLCLRCMYRANIRVLPGSKNDCEREGNGMPMMGLSRTDPAKVSATTGP